MYFRLTFVVGLPTPEAPDEVLKGAIKYYWESYEPTLVGYASTVLYQDKRNGNRLGVPSIVSAVPQDPRSIDSKLKLNTYFQEKRNMLLRHIDESTWETRRGSGSIHGRVATRSRGARKRSSVEDLDFLLDFCRSTVNCMRMFSCTLSRY